MKTQIVREKLFDELENISGNRDISIGPVKGRLLIDVILKHGVKRVLEIGTNIGYSAILIARVLPDDGKVVTIEIDVKSAAQALCNFQKTRCNHKIEIRIGNAEIMIPMVQEEFDMVFIDADKSSYLNYLILGDRKLKRGGIIFADNVKMYASEMLDYLDYVRFSGRYESRHIDVGDDGIEITRKLF